MTLKKFRSLLKNIPLVSKTSQNWVDISRAKCSKSGQRQTGPEASDSKNGSKAAHQCEPLSTRTVHFERRRRLMSNPFFSSSSFELGSTQKN